MSEIVKTLALPPELKITIRGACDALAPEDALDRRLRRGLAPEKEDGPELARRRKVARSAAVRLATAIDGEAAAALLAPCEGWLTKAPEVKDVEAHLLAVGLVEEYAAPSTGRPNDPTAMTRGARPSLGSPSRRACYAALLTFKESIPSACAQRLYDVAMILARAYEAAGRKESGSAHAYVAGLIGSGS